MKKIILGFLCVAVICIHANAQQNERPSETEKREALNLQLWKKAHPHIKIVSFQNFSSRQKKSRDYMLMHGVLIYEGNELSWSDVQLFETGQRPTPVQNFINDENALHNWLNAHPNVKIISQAEYDSLGAGPKAEFDALPEKIVYPGARLTWQDVMNYPN